MKKAEITPVVPKTRANDLIQEPKVITKITPISPEFIPTYKNPGDACCDLRANLNGDDLIIGSLETRLIDVGFKIELPTGWEAQIRCRSGWASKGLIITNGIGTIDEGFRGEVKVIVTNISKEPITIKHKDRIAQMALKPVYQFYFQETDTLDNSADRGGGFGSTGIK